MNLNKKKLEKIKGDASFRKFYRKKLNKASSIIVYAKKEKVKNLLNYDAINKILLKKNISAPKLLSESFSQNYIEIEDFGKKTLFNILKKKPKNKIKIYKKILIVLKKLQKIKIKKIENFKNKIYRVPIYSRELIYKETCLFLKWYVPKFYKKKKTFKINNQLKKIIKNLLERIKLPNDTFVHRDFHVSNMILKKNNISIIDTQDAVYGNISYDLASFIDDVRLQTSINTKKIIYKEYLKLNKNKINIKKFQNDFEILSVLRNLKIIGIFTRLAKRDKKKQYLKLIPYAWKLIELRLNDNNFIDLKKNLEINFPKKIRIQK